AAEQDLQQLGQGRVGDVTGELAVVARVAGVEAVLVRQTDHHLVDQRAAQTRDLGPGAALEGGQVVAGARVDDPHLAQAGRGPATDHVPVTLEAGDGQLQGQGGDVL